MIAQHQIEYKTNAEMLKKNVPINGAIENDAKDRPILANPIAEPRSLNDSLYNNGPFPGIALANTP